MKSSSSFYWATDAQRESFCRDEDVGLSLPDSDEEDEETAVEIAEWRPLVGKQETYGTHRKSTKMKSIRFQDESIRFQVVIWYVGPVNVQIGQVSMRFRITLFWNDKRTRNNGEAGKFTTWTMEGRQMACLQIVNDNKTRMETVDVPPVSILNAVSFELVGSPEVSMLDEDDRLMRWTCMYSAILSQTDHLDIRNFPHDKHDLMLKIGILAHRNNGSRWDRNVYSLDLATKQDSQGSTSIPHGLVLDHVAVPDFSHDELKFEFVPLNFGGEHIPLGRQDSSGRAAKRKRDSFLQVSLPVRRQSGHYDKSIIPILAMLNIVAITCLPRNFDSATASTETILSIAFVQVGIRLTIDSRLPSVGYQIKMQRILNMSFWLLCFLVLESNVVFTLVTKMGWEISTTDWIDLVSACISFLFTVHILLSYYWTETYFDLSRLKHVVSSTMHSGEDPAEHL
jgi:hypothetical protein